MNSFSPTRSYSKPLSPIRAVRFCASSFSPALAERKRLSSRTSASPSGCSTTSLRPLHRAALLRSSPAPFSLLRARQHLRALRAHSHSLPAWLIARTPPSSHHICGRAGQRSRFASRHFLRHTMPITNFTRSAIGIVSNELATPDHALQRTAPGVRACAPARSPAPAVFPSMTSSQGRKPNQAAPVHAPVASGFQFGRAKRRVTEQQR